MSSANEYLERLEPAPSLCGRDQMICMIAIPEKDDSEDLD